MKTLSTVDAIIYLSQTGWSRLPDGRTLEMDSGHVFRRVSFGAYGVSLREKQGQYFVLIAGPAPVKIDEENDIYIGSVKI